MSEMIERVARALCAPFPEDEPIWLGVHMKRWESHKDSARAVIKAMRIPTEEMRSRYNDPDVVGYGPDGSDHDKVWEAGIDAALKEQTK